MDGKSAGIGEIAARHGFSEGAAGSLLAAMRGSHGAMAQFSHPELGGMGQWSRGGMLMIGDMFDAELKARVGALADELSRSLGAQAGGGDDAPRPPGDFAPLHREDSERWWPAELGQPASAGAQNGIRYAVFPDKHRLAVEKEGRLSVRDTGANRISGVSQQQGEAASLRFSGDRGTVDLANLPET